jgi:2,3-bisphosphoglycerate-independent phosphoglycerate mutase
VAPDSPGNAVSLANIPTYRKLLANFPSTTLLASGEAVGLPYGEPGNSEVGHLNIGAGRIVYQDLPRINMSIADGTFLNNQTLISAVERAKERKSKIHLVGLVGLSGVHSSIEHLYALLWLIKEHQYDSVYLHLFTDGRDSPPTASKQFLPQLELRLSHMGLGKIASVTGRYFGMDRDFHWDRTEKAYQAIALGKASFYVREATQAIDQAYERGETDEFIQPTAVTDGTGRPLAAVDEGDVVIAFNFRTDRMRQLTRAFTVQDFNDFPTRKYADLAYYTLTQYDQNFNLPIAFPPEEVKLPLARVISESKLRQLHIAETEKYPHVTYFLNGGREAPFSLEDRILVPSPKVATYDQEPAMSTSAISELIVGKIKSRSYDLLVANIANPDMVGHSGDLAATIKALEADDKLFDEVSRAVLGHYGALIITADHGNAEAKFGPNGEVQTGHTTNPVPFIAVTRELMTSNQKKLQSGILADVAPSVLSLMGLNIPQTMTGRNLLAELL